MIEHIFPSPLYYSQVRNNNKIKYHIDRCIDNVEFTKKKEWSSPHWLAPSDFNSNILKDLGIHSLLDEIDYHIEVYCNELSFKKRPYQILSWFSKFTRDDYAIEHNHNDADISGVYYYQTKDDAPEIYFTSPNPYLDDVKRSYKHQAGSFVYCAAPKVPLNVPAYDKLPSAFTVALCGIFTFVPFTKYFRFGIEENCSASTFKPIKALFG